MKETTYNRIITSFKKDPNATIRVDAEDFQTILLENTKYFNRYIQGIPLGVGIYAIKLLPKEWSSEFGNICLDAKTAWITRGTGLVLKPCDCGGEKC